MGGCGGGSPFSNPPQPPAGSGGRPPAQAEEGSPAPPLSQAPFWPGSSTIYHNLWSSEVCEEQLPQSAGFQGSVGRGAGKMDEAGRGENAALPAPASRWGKVAGSASRQGKREFPRSPRLSHHPHWRAIGKLVGGEGARGDLTHLHCCAGRKRRISWLHRPSGCQGTETDGTRARIPFVKQAPESWRVPITTTSLRPGSASGSSVLPSPLPHAQIMFRWRCSLAREGLRVGAVGKLSAAGTARLTSQGL